MRKICYSGEDNGTHTICVEGIQVADAVAVVFVDSVVDAAVPDLQASHVVSGESPVCT